MISDKISHGYMPFYEALFKTLTVSRLLEIGVQSGASIEMFRTMLPEAQICGIDVDRPPIDGCIWGDATKPFAGMEGPWDVIIDDGSHDYNDIRASQKMLWPYLKSGGYYIVEDVPNQLQDERVPWKDQLVIIRKP